ncbi:damage-inducible protein DinB [Paenibacillus sambharensis]|uniref:Damage-inducible protein DinB n=1 Tax=Paenibacillus sambharensis TaxID=1803190 RepID=A0A2W1M0Q6_9BACL|nr:DinB family protein [Paenibacillus sambharensis]PZD97297.1 damage-inducible protein DinB [Paenibacillus sambharensis]
MNEKISLLYDYNIWANDRVVHHIKSLPNEVFCREVNLGFTSIAELISHIATADGLWLARIKGESPSTAVLFKDIAEASSHFNQLQAQIREYLLSVKDVDQQITYTNTRGHECQNSVSEIIQHIINHGTYHRGNISTILRSIGYEGVLTDYMAFLWMKEGS